GRVAYGQRLSREAARWGEGQLDAPSERGAHGGERGAHALAGLGAGRLCVWFVRELGFSAPLTLTLSMTHCSTRCSRRATGSLQSNGCPGGRLGGGELRR